MLPSSQPCEVREGLGVFPLGSGWLGQAHNHIRLCRTLTAMVLGTHSTIIAIESPIGTQQPCKKKKDIKTY